MSVKDTANRILCIILLVPMLSNKWLNWGFSMHVVLGCLHGNHLVETVLLRSTNYHRGGTSIGIACVARFQVTALECEIIQK